LDRVEYSHKSILRYEQMYGPGFVSTGGLGMSYKFSFLFCIASLEIFPFPLTLIW